MKNKQLYFFLIITVSCTHKTAYVSVTPQPTCDSLNTSYVGKIQPIIKANCYSCHASGLAGTGLDLEDTVSLKNYLKIDYRGDGIYGDKFLNIIYHTPGTLQMPPTYTLDSCDLATIKHWINAGAPTN